MEYRLEVLRAEDRREVAYQDGMASFGDISFKGSYPVDHGPRVEERIRLEERRYGSQREGHPRERDAPPRHREEESATGPSRHLWVGNVSSDVTDEMLQERFAKYGEVESATVYGLRNYAFVNFRNVDDAAAAKRALQGITIKGGLPIRIEFAKGARPSRHLWVGGISPNVTRQQLESEFQRYGRLEDFRFLRDRNCAHVDYAQQDDAVAAVEGLNGKVLGEEALRVEYGRTPYRGSAKDTRPAAFDDRDRLKDHATTPADSTRRRETEREPRPQADRGFQTEGGGSGPGEGEPSEVLWVGFPLYIQVDDDILHKEFCSFGEIVRIKTFPGRTYGFVQFSRVEDAARAKDELEGKLFDDPRVHIKFSKSVPIGHSDPPREEGTYREAASSRHGFVNERHLAAPSSYRPVSPPERPGALTRRDLTSTRGLTTRTGLPIDDAEYISTVLTRAGLAPRSIVRAGYDDWQDGGPGEEDSFRDRREAKRRRFGGYLDAPYDDVASFGPSDGVRRAYELGREHAASMASIPGVVTVSRSTGLSGSLHVDLGAVGTQSPLKSQSISGGSNLARLALPAAASGDRPVTESAPGLWVGALAKGGTLICRARAYAIGKGIDNAIAEVINCTARTDLDVLAKHITMAQDFGVVALVPAENADIGPYEDFVQYLGEKRRAGVAKLVDGSTLFLVPPSDFSQIVLKVPRKDALFGVALTMAQPQSGSSGPSQLPSAQSHLLPAPPPIQIAQPPDAPAQTTPSLAAQPAPVLSQTQPNSLPSVGQSGPAAQQSLPQGLSPEVLASLTSALLPQTGSQQVRAPAPVSAAPQVGSQSSAGLASGPVQGQGISSIRPDAGSSAGLLQTTSAIQRPQVASSFGTQGGILWQPSSQDPQQGPAGLRNGLSQQEMQSYLHQQPQQPTHFDGPQASLSGPQQMQSVPSVPGGSFQQQVQQGGFPSGQAVQYPQPSQGQARPSQGGSPLQLPSDQLAQLAAMLSQRPQAPSQPSQQSSVYLPGQQQQQPQPPPPLSQPSYAQQQPLAAALQQAQQGQFQSHPVPQPWPPLPSQPLYPQQQMFAPAPVQQAPPQLQAPLPHMQQGAQGQWEGHGSQAQPVVSQPQPQPQSQSLPQSQPPAQQQPSSQPQQSSSQQPGNPNDVALPAQPQGEAEAKRFQATLQLAAALLQQMQQQQHMKNS